MVRLSALTHMYVGALEMHLWCAKQQLTGSCDRPIRAHSPHDVLEPSRLIDHSPHQPVCGKAAPDLSRVNPPPRSTGPHWWDGRGLKDKAGAVLRCAGLSPLSRCIGFISSPAYLRFASRARQPDSAARPQKKVLTRRR